MRKVGTRQLEGAAVRASPLEGDHRDDQAGEAEPDHSRYESENAEEAEQNDRGSEGDRSEHRGLRKSPPRQSLSGDDSGRKREGKARCGRRDRERKRQPDGSRRLRESEACGGGCDT